LPWHALPCLKTNFTADLTIMEEANELLKRIDIATNGTEEEKKKSPLPMFTSCKFENDDCLGCIM
jgi:iron only hydrogenase large subunit-like protein